MKALNTFYLDPGEHQLQLCDDFSLPADDGNDGIIVATPVHAFAKVAPPDPTSSSRVSVLVHSIPDTLKDRILLQIHGPNDAPAAYSSAADTLHLLPAYQLITDFSVTLPPDQAATLCSQHGFSCNSDDPEEATDLTVSHRR